MLLTIYLSDEVANLLNCFGDIDDVINRILEAAAEGLIDIMDKPNIAEKKGGHYYKVNIVEPNYIAMLETFGTRSSRISLRRLLYWFIDNEIYSELGWEINDMPYDKKSVKSYGSLMELKNSLYKANKIFPEYKEDFEAINEILREIEVKLWDA